MHNRIRTRSVLWPIVLKTPRFSDSWPALHAFVPWQPAQTRCFLPQTYQPCIYMFLSWCQNVCQMHDCAHFKTWFQHTWGNDIPCTDESRSKRVVFPSLTALFRQLVVNMPQHRLLSQPDFSETALPALYWEDKQNPVRALLHAESISVTTDGWTSRAAQSYITHTAHISD